MVQFLIVGSMVLTVGAYILDSLSEEAERENEKIRTKIRDYHDEIASLKSYEKEKRRAIVKEKFFVLKEKLLSEIDQLHQTHQRVYDELEGILTQIDDALQSGKLSEYYKEENYKSKNLVLYALERERAYFRYLNFYRYKIQNFERNRKYEKLFSLPKLSRRLPDEYLFKGKLLRVEGEEFEKVNSYSQRLVLKPLDEKYRKDRNNIVLIEGYNPDLKAFIGSIVKGELALFYKENSFFEVKVVENEQPFYSNVRVCYKNLHHLQLPKKEKVAQRKLIRNENLEVRIKGSDYLLNYIFVTEKHEEVQGRLLILSAQKFENIFLYRIDQETITLYCDGYLLKGIFRDRYIEIVESKEAKNVQAREIDIDVKFVDRAELETIIDLVDKEEFEKIKNTLIMNYAAQKQRVESIEKYAKILDYQIDTNRFRSFFRPYEIYQEDEHFYYLKVTIDFEISNKMYVKIEEREYSIKDISTEEHFIQIDNICKIPKKGMLQIFIESYPYTLIQQRRALHQFYAGYISNKTIKDILIAPQYKKYTPLVSDLFIEFRNKNLTHNQQEIVKKALNEQELFLIQGPPGTGKTTIIKEIIYQSLVRNMAKHILVVSQQNVAVDNVLEGLRKENITASLLRIASDSKKVYPSLQEAVIEYQFNQYKEKLQHDTGDRWIDTYRKMWRDSLEDRTFKEIDDSIKEHFVKNHTVVGATCMGLANQRLGLEYSEFDLVIIDEAGRATFGELLIPILKAKKVILIGDHKQLPPNTDRVLKEKMEKDEGFTKEDLQILERSYFEELFEKIDPSSKAMLTEQFRMPNEIGSLISELFYEGKLKNGAERSVPDALTWVDVRGRERKEGTTKLNKTEGYIIKKMIQDFQDRSVAIITPYAGQKRFLRSIIHGENIKIDTIDSFQGEEADIVFYSLVRNKGNIEFLLDMRRLNVAISRTKEKLFFVGNRSFFSKNELFNEIIRRCNVTRIDG